MVELLVVLAILSILAALLFSAFAGVREKGRQATCASNLKQIGLAFSLYANDNAQFLPPGAIEGAHHVWQMWPQTVLPYLKTDAVFVCPTDTAQRSEPFSLNSSYGYNTDIAGNLLALIATKNRPDLIPKPMRKSRGPPRRSWSPIRALLPLKVCLLRSGRFWSRHPRKSAILSPICRPNPSPA